MSPLNLIAKIIQIKNGQYKLTISDKKLLNVFWVSSLMLFSQLAMSKKVRAWSINYIHAFFVGGSLSVTLGNQPRKFL
jgi:hypothetical protein